MLALIGAIPLLPGRARQGAEPANPISSSPGLQRRIEVIRQGVALLIGSLLSSMTTRILGIYRHEELLNEVELAIASSTHQR